MGEEQVSDKLKDLILHCKKMEEEERTAALPYTKAPLLRWSLPRANPCPQLGHGGYTARRKATLPRALGNSMDCFPYLWYMALPCSFSDTHSSNSSSNTITRSRGRLQLSLNSAKEPLPLSSLITSMKINHSRHI